MKYLILLFCATFLLYGCSSNNNTDKVSKQNENKNKSNEKVQIDSINNMDELMNCQTKIYDTLNMSSLNKDSLNYNYIGYPKIKDKTIIDLLNSIIIKDNKNTFLKLDLNCYLLEKREIGDNYLFLILDELEFGGIIYSFSYSKSNNKFIDVQILELNYGDVEPFPICNQSSLIWNDHGYDYELICWNPLDTNNESKGYNKEINKKQIIILNGIYEDKTLSKITSIEKKIEY